ncbi:sensor histidine kinase [Nonomuraea sp. NEAU-A123]|uniref:sensor histidine kinase n=1 Tax=Nonomuraea sp. NEAU-A123 TaxID=2839649 RepID=UPI001BE4CE0A|nr:sensor histidine kinase [Nonomuraea sp. NEAU-A123]MBT2231985.1 sensor domain-containing protein [Nonomuraea sp. NEAU-A123]
MSTHDPTAGRRAARGRDAFALARARAILDALEHLVGGLGTAVLAFVALVLVIATALTCLIGVGLLLAPVTLRVVRAVADRERGRLSRWGPEVVGPAPIPHGLRAALADSAVRREVGWVAAYPVLGLFLGAVAISLPIYVVEDTLFPLYWRMLPPEEVSARTWGLWTVHDWPTALAVALLGLGWIVVTTTVTPGMAWLQAWPGRRLLAPVSGTDLALRVVQLTATRAAALDAHSAELRRIERSLHDGTQNRIVAVNVLLGAARRALTRDPATAEAILERAQDAAEQALAELRGVVRSILPPVLTDRSLADALTGLATACPVPCRIDADLPVRCASSVEATAYFVVAETLTNIAKHSRAGHATVAARLHDDRLHLQISDDGQGGADERNGSGFVGIRRRTEAHDGTFMLNSPPGGPTTVTVSLPCGS